MRPLAGLGGVLAAAWAAHWDVVGVLLLLVAIVAAATVVRRPRARAVRHVAVAIAAGGVCGAIIAGCMTLRPASASVPMLVSRTATAGFGLNHDPPGAGSSSLSPAGLTSADSSGLRAQSHPGGSRPPWEVLGFFASDFTDSLPGLDRDAPALSEVAATGMTMGNKPGSVATLPQGDIVLRAHINDARGYVVLSNYDAGTDDFNGQRAGSVLADVESRSRLVAAVAEQVNAGGWDGVVLDVEALPARSRGDYVRFTRGVKAAVAPRPVLVATPAGGRADTPGLQGYDLAGLASAADRVVWMAYDEHEPGSIPGPVASHDWVVAGLKVALAAVPADKLLLGVAGYGYSWAQRGEGRSLTYVEASELARRSGSRSSRDASGEWHITTVSGERAWFSDAVAVKARAALARSHGLAGVALWRVGAEDPKTLAGLAAPALKHSGLPVSRPIQYVTGRGLVALTFDDGPDPTWTPKILDVLRRHKVPGTFFVVGSQAQAHPELVRQAAAQGVVAHHTYSHPDMSRISELRAKAEILAGAYVVEGIIGRKPLLFRSPYGDSDHTDGSTSSAGQLAASLGAHQITWTDDSLDWTKPGVQQIVERTTARLTQTAARPTQERAIVLLHDGGGDRRQTVAALDRIISKLKERGYIFTTADRLDGGVHTAYTPRRGVADKVRGTVLISTLRLWDGIGSVVTWLAVAVALVSAARLVLTVPLALTHAATARRRRAGPGARPSSFTVTVIIPARNEAKVIGTSLAALRPLLGCEGLDQVVVVDDGSSDTTAEVARRYGITVITQPNSGKAAAVNTGIARATGDVIVVIDADTIITSGFLTAVTAYFADPLVGAVAANVKVGNRRGVLTRLQAAEYVTSLNLDRRAQTVTGTISVVPGAAGAFRQAALLSVGGYPSETLVEDADLTVRLLRAGWKIRFEPGAVAYTEAPERVRAVLRQRQRWSFGTMQLLALHREAMGRRSAGPIGVLGLPWILITQVVMPFLAPVADLFLLVRVLSGDAGPAVTVVAMAALFDVVVVAGVVLADKEDWRLIVAAPLLRVVWRPLQVIAVTDSALAWVRGHTRWWIPSQRYASVRLPAGHGYPHPTKDCPSTMTSVRDRLG